MNAGSEKMVIKLWKPQRNLPWSAEKKGTDTYFWYLIFDSYGDEVCSFGAVRHGEEHDECFRQVAFLLVTVNGNPVIEIDGKKILIEWGAETNATEGENDGRKIEGNRCPHREARKQNLGAGIQDP